MSGSHALGKLLVSLTLLGLPACAGSNADTAEPGADGSSEYALMQYSETGDTGYLRDFLQKHPNSPDANQIRELVAKKELERSLEEEGEFRVRVLEDLMADYPQTRAAKDARGRIEVTLLDSILEPPNIVQMIEFLKGPSRADASTSWSYLDDSDRASEHRESIRTAAVALLTQNECSDTLRYCNRWVNTFSDDPNNGEIQKLIAKANKRKKLEQKQWMKFAGCANRCTKRCGTNESKLERCMVGCSKKYQPKG